MQAPTEEIRGTLRCCRQCTSSFSPTAQYEWQYRAATIGSGRCPQGGGSKRYGITHDESEYKGGEPEGPWVYEMQTLGYNYRITDFQAALLISQLNKLEKFSKRRWEIVEKYNKAFEEIPEIIVQQEIPESETTRHLYILRLDLDKLSCTRREFFDAMREEGIQCQVHYVPVYYFPFYAERGYKKGLCPVVEDIYKGIMSIPLYPKMTDQDVEDVIHAVKKIVKNYKKY